jgi:pilus assembly protein FimV
MKTKYRISTAAFLAAASLTFSSPAWSLGLGDVTVESYLNQPLQVKIDLITRETDDLAAVRAQLASVDDYELIGASREAMPVPIRFSVEDIEGDAYLLGTSNLPVKNPVVRLIVEVTYASGRLLREYTVFLDPPTQAAQAPIPRVDKRKNPPVAEPSPAPAPAAAEPSAESPAEPEQMQPSAAPASSAPAEPGQGEYGPVASGETLWEIAKDWSRGSGMDLNKVMIAIQRENPNAFLRGNINLLKRGAILRMPRAEDVRNMSTAAAISEVSEQTEAFRGSKPSETVVSPSTPLLAVETESFAEPEPVQPPPAPDETPVTEVEEALAEPGEALVEAEADIAETVSEETPGEPEQEPLAEADSEPQLRDQLELVPPSEESDLDSAYGFEETEEDIADASVATSALRENLARTEEELITQQQQNEYLEERIRELEAQLADAEDDNVKDADMANMEERLRQERQQQTAAQEASEPWYSKIPLWLVGLLVLAAGAVGWLLSRRGGEELLSEEEQIKEIKDEAEEVLRVLEEPPETPEEQPSEEQAEQAAEESEDEGAPKGAQEKPVAASFGTGGDDAELLDEESSDPEIQLDLARAYISMGDKEAARVILEEVQNNGNESQREEAKKMLDLLVS